MKVVKLLKNDSNESLTRIDFKQLDRLVIKNREGCHVLKFSNILFLKSDSNYTEIYTNDDKQFIASKTLKSLQSKLGDFFIRVHQSYIVNILFIEEYHYHNGIRLANNEIIPVSNSMKKKVRSMFK